MENSNTSRMNLTKFFKNEPPVRVYQLNTDDPRWPQYDHTHDYMQIWYVKKGSCTHYVENGVYNMVASNLLVIPPDVSHKVINASKDCKIYGLEFPIQIVLTDNIITTYNEHEIFKFAYIESFELAIKNTRPCYVPSKACQISIEQYFSLMFKTYENREIFYEAELKADLLKMLVAIYRDYQNNKPIKKQSDSYLNLILDAVKYIDKNYSEKLYINDIANMSMMCVSYFSYFFKEVTGKTFVDYLNTQRIEKAKELLVKTDISIDEISEMTGFTNRAYFSRVFKSTENLTPVSYRIKQKELLQSN